MPLTMPGAAVLLDNPLLVKHLRSRLRRGQVVPWLSIVVVLGLYIAWAGLVFGGSSDGVALAIILGLEVLILVFAGAAQVGGAVGGARESGILDFHRVSPQPPSWTTLGFFLGAPAREYLLFAATMPFALMIAAQSPAGIPGLLRLWVALLFVAWIVHALALLSALMSRKPKRGSLGGLAGFVVLAVFLGQPTAWGIWYASTELQEGATIKFFGLPLPWLLFVVVYGAAALSMLLLAAARLMRSDTAHAYAKVEAVACMVLLAVLLLGAFWGYEGLDGLVLVLLYALTGEACVLAAIVTPGRAEYVRGLSRALGSGQRRPGAWTDEGTNQVVVLILAAVVFLGATVTWEAIVGRHAGGPTTYSQTIAIGVFVAAYFGLGLQYFKLRLPKSGVACMGLFLFLAWLLPLFVGWIVLGTMNNEGLGHPILALSPLAGILMSSGLVEGVVAPSARLAAIIPAVTFAFLFRSLLVNTQRRIDHAVRSAPGLFRKPPGPFDFLDLKRTDDAPGLEADSGAGRGNPEVS